MIAHSTSPRQDGRIELVPKQKAGPDGCIIEIRYWKLDHPSAKRVTRHSETGWVQAQWTRSPFWEVATSRGRKTGSRAIAGHTVRATGTDDENSFGGD